MTIEPLIGCEDLSPPDNSDRILHGWPETGIKAATGRSELWVSDPDNETWTKVLAPLSSKLYITLCSFNLSVTSTTSSVVAARLGELECHHVVTSKLTVAVSWVRLATH